MVSIIIPSRNEKYLERTVNDVLSKAQGDIEVIVILDGYDTTRVDGVVYIHNKLPMGMRASIVSASKIAKGKFLMKLDAHCIVDEGFDIKLAKDCQDNMVVIPRRHKLDEEKWEVKPEYIDYEHFIYPPKFNPASLHGFRWDERQKDRASILIDDNLTFQGSCWFMKKSHFEKHKLLQDPGYCGVPNQEAEEIGLTTWLSGGRVVTNKNTWYAHWFKGKSGRGYHLDNWSATECYKYSYNKWVMENKEGFIKLIEKFMPISGWSSNWKEKLWETH